MHENKRQFLKRLVFLELQTSKGLANRRIGVEFKDNNGTRASILVQHAKIDLSRALLEF